MNLTLKGGKSLINIIQLLLFLRSIRCLRHKLQIFYYGRQCTVALRSSIQIISDQELQTCSYCLCYHFVLQIKYLVSFLSVYYGSYRRRVQKYKLNVHLSAQELNNFYTKKLWCAHVQLMQCIPPVFRIRDTLFIFTSILSIITHTTNSLVIYYK